MQSPAGDPATSDPAPPELSAPPSGDRFGPFFYVSIGFVALLVAYFTTIRMAEVALDDEMQSRVDDA